MSVKLDKLSGRLISVSFDKTDVGLGNVTNNAQVIAPATNSADYIPQWNSANSKTLKNGLAVGTSANNLVQLDSTPKLPAVNGSALTNLTKTQVGLTNVTDDAQLKRADGDINTFDEKAIVSNDDIVLIEDYNSSYVKKKVKISSIRVGGAGDIIGPDGATDNAIVTFNSSTGKLVQNSLVTIDDNGTINIPTGQSYKINGTAIDYDDVGASPSSHVHTGVYEPANANIQSHISSTSNPHSVTKTQIGLTNVTDNAQVKKAVSSINGNIATWSGTDGDALSGTGLATGSSIGNIVTCSADNTISIDVISEITSSVGVTVDGLKIKNAGFELGSDADGDMYYRSSSALARLAKGTAGQILSMNAGATAPIWSSQIMSIVNGRLTLESGVPISTTDQAAKTTLYFTPYNGNQIALYNGSNWAIYTLTEKSLNISEFTASTPYDIFIYDNSGTLTLEGVIWTNDTTRATALATQDGVYVQNGATTKRYIGTIRTTATTGQCEDSVTKRFVWNMYNRADRYAETSNSNASWSYTTASKREYNNGTGQTRAEIVLGLSSKVNFVSNQHAVTTTNIVWLYVMYDSTSSDANSVTVTSHSTVGMTQRYMMNSIKNLDVGYHYITQVEVGGTGGTVSGTGYGARIWINN